MYKIFADGEIFYAPNISDEGYAIISPNITKDVNKAGSLSFVLPPSHPFYDRMQKLKTIMTVYNGDEMIFRGRVLSFETDFYKRRTVYCEGELAYLNDSVCRPYTFEGNAEGLFRQHISRHNEQVDETAQFTVGNVTVQGTVDVKITEYASTWDSIESMIEYFGGYLYIRHENGVRYIDYLKEPVETEGQIIRFGENLLDLTNHITAEDVFTVLIPLGAAKNNSMLTISSVNQNKDYIQDDAAVALFGKIWKTNQWSDIKTASKLLEKGREYLQKGIAEAVTLSVGAIDLRLVDVDTEMIDVGRKIRVKSDPHGLNSFFICSNVTLDLVNPDRSTYTFGNPKNTATGEMKTAKSKSSRASSKAENAEEVMWGAVADISKTDGHVELLAKQLNNGQTVSWSDIDVTPTRIVSQVGCDGLVSVINQTSGSVKISANKIELDGTTVASALVGSAISCSSLGCDDLTFGIGNGLHTTGEKHRHLITSSESEGTITITIGKATQDVDDDGASCFFDIADTQFYQDGVSAARPSRINNVNAVWDSENEDWQVDFHVVAGDGVSTSMVLHHAGASSRSTLSIDGVQYEPGTYTLQMPGTASSAYVGRLEKNMELWCVDSDGKLAGRFLTASGSDRHIYRSSYYRTFKDVKDVEMIYT